MPGNRQPGAVAERKGNVRVRDRQDARRGVRGKAKERRPELADTNRRPAVGDVREGEAQTRLRLLFFESTGGVSAGSSIEAAEEVHLELSAGGPAGFPDLRPVERQGQTGVPNISAGEPLVPRELRGSGPLRVLAVAECEVLVLGERSGADEPPDDQTLRRRGLGTH